LNFKAPTFGEIVSGVFTPVLAKHSKSFSLIDCISVGVDRMQRNFEPMRKQVETWHKSELTDKSPFFAAARSLLPLPHVQFWETENGWRLDSSHRGGNRRGIPCLVDASDVCTVTALKTPPYGG
jgi:hypothetical protein